MKRRNEERRREERDAKGRRERGSPPFKRLLERIRKGAREVEKGEGGGRETEKTRKAN